MTATERSWSESIEDVVNKLELGAMFGESVSFNRTGSKALALLLKSMAQKLDLAIEGRTTGLEGDKVVARALDIFGVSLQDFPREMLLLVCEWLMLKEQELHDPDFDAARKAVVTRVIAEYAARIRRGEGVRKPREKKDV